MTKGHETRGPEGQAAAAIKRRETMEANGTIGRRGEEARRPVVGFNHARVAEDGVADPTASPTPRHPSRHRPPPLPPPPPPPATPAPSPTTLPPIPTPLPSSWEASPRRRCSSSLRRAVGCATCGLLDGAGTNYIRRETLTEVERHDTRTAWMVVGGWWRGHGAVARPAREREAYRVWE